MVGQAGSDERRARPPMLIDERGDGAVAQPSDKPRIESDGRYAKPNEEPPPDPRAVIEDLRRKLRAEQEKSLNSVDAVMGARAAAAQAKAETQETFYRLHVRETELAQLKELMAEQNQPAATPGPSSTGSPGTGSWSGSARPSTNRSATGVTGQGPSAAAKAAEASTAVKSMLGTLKRLVKE